MSQHPPESAASVARWELGMIGLGVMGRNFLLNLAGHGFPVAGFDQDPGQVAALVREGAGLDVAGAADLAALVKKQGRRLLVDSMSAFGAIEIDARNVYYDALAASSNKCLEGVPGLGFVVCRNSALADCKGNATTLVLDLFDQAEGFAKTGQYRFTPPIHVIVALGKAIEEHAEEGGVAGRGKRYRENAKVLIDGMRAMGFQTLLPNDLQAPIIITFHMPTDPKFVFQNFYDGLKDRGYVIYPGKLTVADSFRMGCIGRLYPDHMRGALAAVREVLDEMRVTNGGPALAAE